MKTISQEVPYRKPPGNRDPFAVSMSEQDSTDMRGIKGMKGYYRRPSRAIEKGGGFYVPGLEGERIRIITAGALVLMFVANRAGQTVATFPQVVSELTGIAVALLLFAQGAADVFGGGGGAGEADSQQQEQSLAALSYLSVLQNNFGADGRSGQGPAVEAIARSLVQTSEDALYIAALSRQDGRVLFELGPVQGSAMTSLQGRALVDAAQISSSSSPPSPRGLTILALDILQQRAQQPLTCLPASTKSVGVAAAGDLVWVLACAAPVEAIAPDTRSWMQSLLSAPL